MAYNESLADRVRRLMAREARAGITERKMFGGICFMLRGRMVCGVLGDDLVVRVGPGEYERALEKPHARAMDFTGPPLRGFVYVGPGGVRTGAALATWARRALAFVSSLRKK